MRIAPICWEPVWKGKSQTYPKALRQDRSTLCLRIKPKSPISRDDPLDSLGRYRSAEEIALSVAAAHGLEAFGLRFGFDALRRHGRAELIGQRHHSLENGRCSGILS